jgi:cytoskeletal protein RodZ
MKKKTRQQAAAGQRSPVTGSSLNLAVRRAKSGVTLEQISQASNLSTRFLRAIEEERFDELPGGIFTVSYIRQYAEAIGCNAEEILEAARRKLEPGTLPLSGGPETAEATRGKRPGRSGIWSWRSAGNLLR